MRHIEVISLIAGFAMLGACSSNGSANHPGSGGKTGTGGTGASTGTGGQGVGGGTGTVATGGKASTGGSGGGQGGVIGDSGVAGSGGSSLPIDAATGGAGGVKPGSGGAAGASGGAGAGGGPGVDSATGDTPGGTGATTLVSCPNLPGATASKLYSVTVNGSPLFVEQLTKYSPEMQVHYAHGSLSGTGTATIAVTVNESFSAYTLSPKSRKLAVTKSGNTLTFTSGPNDLILQVDTKELLFILLDAAEASPPQLGDANVKNIADYKVDNTGATLMTSKIQSAVDAASGATQNILYFPPGKYLIGELWLKSNMTVYLACGAVLYGSNTTGDFNTGSGGINIEDAQHALIRMYQIKNTSILGRGVLDSNGHSIRGQGLNANLLKIEQSSNITVDGIVSRDPSYWNTLVYRSDQVTIQNYKVINCRPTTGSTVYNQTDGVDFDESTNGKLFNAFLYTGDDGMAPKNEDSNGTINSKNLSHEHIVVYNNSVGCKIGTKSMGKSMDTITFKDIDIVKAGRAMTIEAYDTAVVSNVTFEDVRVEAADSMLINLALDQPPTWRTAANTGSYKDIYFTNVSSDVKQVISLHGKSATVNINGVHFKNFTVQGKAITSQTDADASWDINSYVSNITFE
jgi:Pectate lyase superfamily protein